MIGRPTQHDGHLGGGQVWFSRHEEGGVSAVESRAVVEEHHLLRLAFGVEVGDDFEGRVALDQRHLHVERAEVNAEDGFGEGR